MYRNLYRRTWSHAPTAFVLAHTANLMIFDDHEVLTESSSSHTQPPLKTATALLDILTSFRDLKHRYFFIRMLIVFAKSLIRLLLKSEAQVRDDLGDRPEDSDSASMQWFIHQQASTIVCLFQFIYVY